MKDSKKSCKKILLSTQFERWRALKFKSSLRTDNAVAEFLLDAYEFCFRAHLSEPAPEIPTNSSQKQGGPFHTCEYLFNKEHKLWNSSTEGIQHHAHLQPTDRNILLPHEVSTPLVIEPCLTSPELAEESMQYMPYENDSQLSSQPVTDFQQHSRMIQGHSLTNLQYNSMLRTEHSSLQPAAAISPCFSSQDKMTDMPSLQVETESSNIQSKIQTSNQLPRLTPGQVDGVSSTDSVMIAQSGSQLTNMQSLTDLSSSPPENSNNKPEEVLVDVAIEKLAFNTGAAMFKLVSDPTRNGKMIYIPYNNEQCDDIDSETTEPITEQLSPSTEQGEDMHPKRAKKSDDVDEVLDLSTHKASETQKMSDGLSANPSYSKEKGGTPFKDNEPTNMVWSVFSDEDSDSGFSQNFTDVVRSPQQSIAKTTTDTQPSHQTAVKQCDVDIEVFECNKCSKTFKSFWHILCSHFVEDHPTDPHDSCDLCGYVYDSHNLNDVSTHFRTVHGVTNFVDPKTADQFDCQNCQEVYSSPITFLFHLEQDHPETVFQCCLCPYMSKHRYQISQHMKSCHNKTDFSKYIQDIMEIECTFGDSLSTKREPEGSAWCRMCGPDHTVQDLHHHLTEKHQEPRFKQQFACYKCAVVTKSYRELATHQEEAHKTNSVVLECLYCLVSFTSVSLLKEHCLFTHLRKKTYCCEYCHQHFGSTAHLGRHRYLYYHECGGLSQENVEKGDACSAPLKVDSFTCNECPNKFPSWVDLCAHKLWCHTSLSVPRCNLCNVIFSDTASVGEHIRSDHQMPWFTDIAADGCYHCRGCEEKHQFDLSFLFHVEEAHLHTPYTCPNCMYTTQHFYQMEHHRSQHCSDTTVRQPEPEAPQKTTPANQQVLHKCAMCDSLVHGPSVCSHLKTVHPEALALSHFSCPHCKGLSQPFTSYSLLDKHIVSDHRDNLLGNNCLYCKFRCFDGRRYEAHVKEIHLKIKLGVDVASPSSAGKITHHGTFICNVCGKNFRRYFSLKRHLWNHQKSQQIAKPQKCQLCDFTCVGHSALVSHKRIHKDIKI